MAVPRGQKIPGKNSSNNDHRIDHDKLITSIITFLSAVFGALMVLMWQEIKTNDTTMNNYHANFINKADQLGEKMEDARIRIKALEVKCERYETLEDKFSNNMKVVEQKNDDQFNKLGNRIDEVKSKDIV